MLYKNKLLKLNFDEDLLVLENYKLSPNELFLVQCLLLYREDDREPICRFLTLGKEIGLNIREILISLQDKRIITREYKIPKDGEPFLPEEVVFNQNFVKNYHKASYELGKELFDNYPQFTTIQGIITPLRSVSKKFDSLEQFFRYYGKVIHHNIDLHNRIIELIKWDNDNSRMINTTLCNFVVDQKWNDIEALKNGDKGNINFSNVRVL